MLRNHKKTLELNLSHEKKHLFSAECKYIASNILFPSTVSINSLDISNLKNWRAKDYRNFLFYITPHLYLTVLSDIDNIFYSLREELHLLFSKISSPQKRESSAILFRKFIFDFSLMFGEHNLTPNFHDLNHLPSIVENSGPLYEYSAFNFEHLNGRLSSMCNGNKRLDKQILFKMNNAVTAFHNNFNDNCCQEIIKLKDKLFEKKNWKPSFFMSKHIYFSGPLDKSNLSEDEIFALNFEFGLNLQNMLYKRAVCYNVPISTKAYDKNNFQKNSNFVSKDTKTFLEILRLGLICESNDYETGPFILASQYSLIKLKGSLFRLGDASGIICLNFSDFNVKFIQAIRLDTYIIPKLDTERF